MSPDDFVSSACNELFGISIIYRINVKRSSIVPCRTSGVGFLFLLLGVDGNAVSGSCGSERFEDIVRTSQLLRLQCKVRRKKTKCMMLYSPVKKKSSRLNRRAASTEAR